MAGAVADGVARVISGVACGIVRAARLRALVGSEM